MNTLLDISGKIDEQSLAVYEAIDDAAKELGIPYIVVGASARDLVLHYGFNARIKRATADIDVGIQVNSWEEFNALKTTLINKGFVETRTNHTLMTPDRMRVDVVPFGETIQEEYKITWPADNAISLNVAGFSEALNHALTVRIREQPRLEIPVVSPSGLTLLKFIAWQERDRNLRKRDAGDLRYLLESYQDLPTVQDSAYDDPDMMEELDWDLMLAGAYILGRHSSNIALDGTADTILSICQDAGQCEQLAEDMCQDIESEFDRAMELIATFKNGFIER